jgi:uncharacterized membrane protein YphA (DoxX/SURF4 family)
LLRIAIGWHFTTEGMEKLRSFTSGDKPFSAEVYLRNATGPLARYFRGMVPDANGLARLDPARLKAAWREDVKQIEDHYGFDTDQRAKAEKELTRSEQFADAWFSDRDMREKRRKYTHDLAEVQKVEWNPKALSYERERAAAKRRELDADRKDLLKDLDARGVVLRGAVTKLATAGQVGTAGPYTPPWTELDFMNRFVTFGVLASGVCLMVGFLTRLSALGAAAFLLNIYLCIPPWPGLPESPKWEGHYFIVDKNLVEMLACLSLACLPTGQWIGLDALFFGRRARARAARAEAEQREHEHAGGRGRR